MTSYILGNNEKSELVRALNQGVRSPFGPGSFPIIAKQTLRIAGTKHRNANSADRYVFCLPQDPAYLLSVSIETALTSTADESATEERIGARLFSSISLTHRNKVITSNSPEYNNMRIDELPTNSPYIEMTEPDTAWNNNTVTVYTNFFCKFTDNVSNSLLLSSVSELQIQAVRNTSLGTLGTITMVPTLILHIARVHETVTSFVPEILSYDNVVDSVALATSATTNTFDIKTKGKVVSAIHCYIRSATGAQQQVKTFALKIGNNLEIFSTTRRLNCINNKLPSTGGVRTFSYYFGLGGISDNREYAGGFATDDTYKIVTTFDAMPAGYTLYIIVEYFSVITIEQGELECV